jgi:hypothetical protein
LPGRGEPFFAPDELPEREAENGMPKGRLYESSRVRQQRRHAFLAASRVVAVD